MFTPLFLGRLGLTEILVLVLLVVLLFGGKKIPELMRGVGRGVKEFKEGLNEKQESEKGTDEEKK